MLSNRQVSHVCKIAFPYKIAQNLTESECEPFKAPAIFLADWEMGPLRKVLLHCSIFALRAKLRRRQVGELAKRPRELQWIIEAHRVRNIFGSSGRVA
jgi:hypothetical protein